MATSCRPGALLKGCLWLLLLDGSFLILTPSCRLLVSSQACKTRLNLTRTAFVGTAGYSPAAALEAYSAVPTKAALVRFGVV